MQEHHTRVVLLPISLERLNSCCIRTVSMCVKHFRPSTQSCDKHCASYETCQGRVLLQCPACLHMCLILNCSAQVHSVIYRKSTCSVTGLSFGTPNNTSLAVCSKQLVCFSHHPLRGGAGHVLGFSLQLGHCMPNALNTKLHSIQSCKCCNKL